MKKLAAYQGVTAADVWALSRRPTFAPDNRVIVTTLERFDRNRYLPPMPEFRAYAQMCLSVFTATVGQRGGVTPSMYRAIGGEHRPYSILDGNPVSTIKDSDCYTTASH